MKITRNIWSEDSEIWMRSILLSLLWNSKIFMTGSLISTSLIIKITFVNPLKPQIRESKAHVKSRN